MIKIGKWEDLAGKENSKYAILCGVDYEKDGIEAIEIHNFYNKTLITIFVLDTPKEATLSILKQFGFDVEFVEKAELNEKAKNHIKGLLMIGYSFVAVNKNGIVLAFQDKPKREANGWSILYEAGKDIINLSSIGINKSFAFQKWEDEPLFLDDLEV